MFKRFYLLLFGVIICVTVTSQINPQKRDSLARVIEKKKNEIQAHQDSFTKGQDSVFASKQTEIKRNSRPVTGNENPASENKGNAVLLPVALAIFLLILFIWKRRQDRKV